MPETQLQPWAYRIVRFSPALTRDEWINLGVILFAPGSNQLEARLIRDEGEFARVRRLHPNADLSLLRNLEAELTARLAGFEGDAAGHVTKLDDTLSNLIQLSPQRAVLTENAAAEMDRLYDEYVAPPAALRSAAASAEPDTPSAIRKRANQIFGHTGVLRRMQPLRAEAFTYRGDTMRIDYHYRCNGTQGFLQALALGRDPAQAKAFAFTAQRIRAKVDKAELCAVTDVEPQEQNDRHAFVSSLFGEQKIEIVPLPRLLGWARLLAARIQ